MLPRDQPTQKPGWSELVQKVREVTVESALDIAFNRFEIEARRRDRVQGADRSCSAIFADLVDGRLFADTLDASSQGIAGGPGPSGDDESRSNAIYQSRERGLADPERSLEFRGVARAPGQGAHETLFEVSGVSHLE